MMKKFAVGLLSGVLMISVGNAVPWGKKAAPDQTQQPQTQQSPMQKGMQNRPPASAQTQQPRTQQPQMQKGMQNRPPAPMQQQMGGGGGCPALGMKEFTDLLTKGMVSKGVNLKKISMNKGGAGKRILSLFGKQKAYEGEFVPANLVSDILVRDQIQVDVKGGGIQTPNAGFCVYKHNPGGKPESLLAAISTEPAGAPTPPRGGIMGQIAQEAAQKVKASGQNAVQNTAQQIMQQGQNVMQQGMQPYVQPQQPIMQQQAPYQQNRGFAQAPVMPYNPTQQGGGYDPYHQQGQGQGQQGDEYGYHDDQGQGQYQQGYEQDEQGYDQGQQGYEQDGQYPEEGQYPQEEYQQYPQGGYDQQYPTQGYAGY